MRARRRVSLVCEQLDGGRITAVDRSPRMIEMAVQRNHRYARNARFIAASLEQADRGEGADGQVFAVHVGPLRHRGEALDTVRRRLADGGRLYLFSQAPGWKAAGQAEGFGAKLGRDLEAAGFAIDATLVKDVGTAFAAAVSARAGHRPLPGSGVRT